VDPDTGLFVPDIQNFEFQYAVCRALNDWTAKVWATGKRHLWCVSIPQKPEWAVAEISAARNWAPPALDAAERDERGALWNEDWDPVWKTMTDLGMSLVFHERPGTYNATYSTDYKFDKYWVAHAGLASAGEWPRRFRESSGWRFCIAIRSSRCCFAKPGRELGPYMLFRLDSHVGARPARGDRAADDAALRILSSGSA
jgi:hypothetical protein